MYTNALDKYHGTSFCIHHIYILCAGTRKERGLIEWAADNILEQEQ